MRFGLFFCILIVLLAFSLLVSGSEVLTWALIEDPFVPLGNVLTWMAAIALPMSLYLGIRRNREPKAKFDRLFKSLVIVAIVLGVLWYPVTWLLADNFSGSFGGGGEFRGSSRAGEYFWYYTYIVVGFPLVLWIAHLLIRLFRK